jgi:hypothetical protein
MHDDLLAIAGQLAGSDAGRPRQASLQRAISTAYYALFHGLCDACVAALIGWQHRPWSWSVVAPTYRALDHGTAKKCFRGLRSRPDTPDELRGVADASVDLQEARLRADYDPEVRFAREDALQFVDQAATAIALLRAMPAQARLELVVQLVFRPR